jgi:integrase
MADTRLRKRGTKNGRDVWTALIPLPQGPGGKRRRHRFTFVGNKTDAGNALVSKLSQVSQGAFIAPDRTTFGQYLDAWLASPPTNYARKTLERFESMARVHLKPTLGGIPLQKLSSADLRNAYAQWRKNLSAQTIVHHHRLIHRVLGQAVEENLARHNAAVFKRADRPRASRAEARFLSSDEIVRLLQAAEGTSLRPLIVLALATGARRGELLGLKWSDVNFDRGTLAIRRALDQTKTGVLEKTPKNGKSRVLPLPVSAIEALRLQRSECLCERSNYVFPGADGGAWIPHKVSDGFRELCRKAKIAGASFHSLRHTAATQMLELEVPPKVVQERLGHSTIAITMDLYSHATPSLQLEATHRIEGILARLLAEASRE